MLNEFVEFKALVIFIYRHLFKIDNSRASFQVLKTMVSEILKFSLLKDVEMVTKTSLREQCKPLIFKVLLHIHPHHQDNIN